MLQSLATMGYRVAADGVLIIHAGFIAFVIFGLIAIWMGIFLRWEWVRNVWFRAAHLLTIAWIVGQALLDITCPLTTWENTLRLRGGQDAYDSAGCIQFWLHRAIFYTAPPIVFKVVYLSFAALVIGTLIFAPPRWRRRRVEPIAATPQTTIC